MAEFEMIYFVDEERRSHLLKNIKNNSDFSAVDYTFSVNVLDYITVNNSLPTKDELAIKYVLKKSEFSTLEDLEKSVERTWNDVERLTKFIALGKTLWNLLVTNKSNTLETVECLKFLTNKDVEFNKITEDSKIFLEQQRQNLTVLDSIKQHFLKVLNDMYFYMENIRNKMKQIEVSTLTLIVETRLKLHT